MLCPKCYGKINKGQTRCNFCGFDTKIMQGATNKQAKKNKHTIYRDDILYTTDIPADVSKKKLLLFSIFLGLFGVHNFYVGKFWQGLYMCLTTSITAILSTITSTTITANAFYTAYLFVLGFQGITVFMWIIQIAKIFLERFKIPVYKDEFSKR